MEKNKLEKVTWDELVESRKNIQDFENGMSKTNAGLEASLAALRKAQDSLTRMQKHEITRPELQADIDKYSKTLTEIENAIRSTAALLNDSHFSSLLELQKKYITSLEDPLHKDDVLATVTRFIESSNITPEQKKSLLEELTSLIYDKSSVLSTDAQFLLRTLHVKVGKGGRVLLIPVENGVQVVIPGLFTKN